MGGWLALPADSFPLLPTAFPNPNDIKTKPPHIVTDYKTRRQTVTRGGSGPINDVFNLPFQRRILKTLLTLTSIGNRITTTNESQERPLTKSMLVCFILLSSLSGTAQPFDSNTKGLEFKGLHLGMGTNSLSDFYKANPNFILVSQNLTDNPIILKAAKDAPRSFKSIIPLFDANPKTFQFSTITLEFSLNKVSKIIVTSPPYPSSKVDDELNPWFTAIFNSLTKEYGNSSIKMTRPIVQLTPKYIECNDNECLYSNTVKQQTVQLQLGFDKEPATPAVYSGTLIFIDIKLEKEKEKEIEKASKAKPSLLKKER